MSFTHLIYDYARGKKERMIVESKFYKKGYKEFVVREVKGRPFATFVAGLNEETGKFHIGIACCDTRDHIVVVYDHNSKENITGTVHDVFSKQRGRTEARERMQEWTAFDFAHYIAVMPINVKSHLLAFIERCEAFYQECAGAFKYVEIIKNIEVRVGIDLISK